jgi:hypothetical protein
MPSSTVVEHLTHYLKIEGLNPATVTRRARKNGKKIN